MMVNPARVVLGVCCFLLGAAPAHAAWQVLGKLENTNRSGPALELATASGAHVRIAFVSADVVRVRMSPRAPFERDFSYALALAPDLGLPLQITDHPERDEIELRANAPDSARVVVRTAPTLAIEVYAPSGELIVADDPARPLAFDPASGAVETSKQRDEHELYYGFGEKALPLSRHQQFMTMWNSDTPGYAPGLDPIYESIPFFIALRDGKSYGVFFDNTYRSYFDMGKTAASRYTFGAEGGELNYYVFSGGRERSPANVLRDYTALTGRGALPPLWALGYQQSRYSYTPAAQVLQVARTFREKSIPADVIYLDIGYMDDYRVFTWSPRDFPQPQKLLATLRDDGFHAVTIVDPGIKVDQAYAIYRDGRARGVFTRSAAGDELHATVWPGVCAFPDFTDPKARAWFGSLYAGFADQGVAGFWNDMNEPGVFLPSDSGEPALVHDPGKTFPLATRHAGDGLAGTHARYHNVYGMQMARATFEGLQRLRPEKRPLVLTRAGYAGVQRYSAVWTGDNASTWDHLALSIPMLTNLSVSGVPFVGTDIGGFTGSPDGELYTRWLQAAVLTPFLRTHSAIDTQPREPWSYGAEFEHINRATIELRYRLLPYLYGVFAASERDGLGVMRPLWLQYPHDVKTYLREDEFLVGADLLVAPVLNPRQTQRAVYFPHGDAWIDWWDGTRHAGGTVAQIAAPIDRLPLFVRAGASVPTQAVIQHTGQMPRTPLTLVVALGADGESNVYEDAGDGYGYRHGESRTLHATLQAQALRLQIPPARGFQRLGAIEFIGIDAAPKRVTRDGRNVRDVSFDATTRRLRVPLPDEKVREIALLP